MRQTKEDGRRESGPARRASKARARCLSMGSTPRLCPGTWFAAPSPAGLGARIVGTTAHPRLHPPRVLVVHEAGIVAGRRDLLVGGAAVEDHQVLLGAVVPVGADHVTAGAAGRDAVAVDLAGEPRLHREDRLAQGFALDEIVRQLVEGPVEVVVDAGIALEHADQNFAVELVVAVEGKAGALADQDAVAGDRG